MTLNAITRAILDYDLTPKQANIFSYGWQDYARFRVAVCGRRFGKTFLIKDEIERAIRKAVEWGVKTTDEIWYCAPTFKQAKRVFWKSLKEIIPKKWLAGKANETECRMELISGHTIRCVGLQNFDDLRGSGLFFVVVDETADIPFEAWEEVIRPALSACRYVKNGKVYTGGHALFIGTPKGFNHFYDFYMNEEQDIKRLEQACKLLPNTFNKRERLVVNDEIFSHNRIIALGLDGFKALYDVEHHQQAEELFEIIESLEWRSWHYTSIEGGNIPHKEIESARRRMDARTFAQEYEAGFMNYSGIVYNQFDIVKNACDPSDRIIPQDSLLIGMDFNIEHMSAIVGVRRGEHLYVLDEIIDVFDTRAMIDEINRRYTQNNIIEIFPDASGENRKTSASESDLALLRKAGFSVLCDAHNPKVKDRVNSVNSLLCNGYDERRLFVNTQRCPKLTQALQRQIWVNGEPDKDPTKGYDHPLDALGYLVHYEFPVTGERSAFYGRKKRA